MYKKSRHATPPLKVPTTHQNQLTGSGASAGLCYFLAEWCIAGLLFRLHHSDLDILRIFLKCHCKPCNYTTGKQREEEPEGIRHNIIKGSEQCISNVDSDKH